MAATSLVMQSESSTGQLLPQRVPLQRPAPGWARVRVGASGVCFADIGNAKRGSGDAPVVPGHEVAGTLEVLGETAAGSVGSARFRVGDRVAVGWFGGSCGVCDACRRGDAVHCADRMIPGVAYAGGYAEHITVPVAALAQVPDGLESVDAAPLGCAGVTTFNAIRRAGIAAGGRVAVFGIGGLGHLAVQFAAKLGYEVVAIARGADREGDARMLGAHHYIDSTQGQPGETLAALGGADLILSTAPTTEPVSELVAGLRVRGRLVMVGIDGGSLTLPAARIAANALVVTGHITGTALDIEETMRFAALHGIRPKTERLPLGAANEALARVEAAQARFRIVLEPNQDGSGCLSEGVSNSVG